MSLHSDESRQALLAQKVIEFLAQRIDPCPESEILSAISGRRRDKVSVIRALRSEGIIAFIGNGKKGDPFRYFVPSPALLPLVETLPGSAENTQVNADETPSKAESAPAFKTYQLPNGNVLSLSKEEFDEIVELFRLLVRQSDKTEGSKSQTEKETLEPGEKQTCSNSKEIEETKKIC